MQTEIDTVIAAKIQNVSENSAASTEQKSDDVSDSSSDFSMSPQEVREYLRIQRQPNVDGFMWLPMGTEI